jgi:Tat protein translocase TatB subunit
MFGTLGGPELFLILVVALIVFGPRKLPDIGKSVGRMMAEFRKASNDFKRTIEDEVEAEKIREATRIEPPAWTPADPPATLPPGRATEADDGAGHDAAPPGEAPPPSPDPTADPPAAAAEETTGEDAPPADTVSRGAAPGEAK